MRCITFWAKVRCLNQLRIMHLLSKDSLAAIFGFAVYWAWIDSSFFGTDLTELFPAGIGHVYYIQFAGLGVAIVVTLIITVIAKKASLSKIFKRPFVLVVSFLGALGTGLGSFAAEQGMIPLAAVCFGVAGVGLAVQVVLWGCLYSIDSLHRGGVWVAGSIAVGIVIQFLVIGFVPTARVIVISLLPLVSAALFMVFPAVTAQNSSKGGSEPPVPANLLGKTAFGLPWRLVLGLVVYSVVFGLMQALYTAPTVEAATFASNLRLASRLAVAWIIFMGMVFFAWRPHIIYRVGLLLMVAGFLLLPFLLLSHGYLVGVATNAGYTCFELMVWVVLFEIVTRVHTPAIEVVGSARLFMMIGCLAGAVSAYVITSTIHLDSMQTMALSSTIVYALMITTVLILDEKSISGIWHLIEGIQQPRDDVGGLSQRCDIFAGRYGFTPREREVLPLLANGRSAPYIARELNVIESTVNFHIRNIYNKCDVHSKQELLDVIEGKHKT